MSRWERGWWGHNNYGFQRSSTVVEVTWPSVGEVAGGEIAGGDVKLGEVEEGEVGETVAMGELAIGEVVRGSRAKDIAAMKPLQNCDRVAGLAAS